jgi:asparagine synthase (glutamine-hydrolysing)
MCGIFLWLSGAGAAAAGVPDEVRAGAARLQHRGPDGSRSVELRLAGDRRGLLAFHRLAIINTGQGNAGMQPFDCADTGYLLVANGMVYNYRQLAGAAGVPVDSLRSDVDVLTRLGLLAPGAPLVELARALSGDWAFVAVHPRTGAVLAGRDPVGVRPLFYGRGAADAADAAPVAFASEAKALLGLPGVSSVHVFPPGHVWDGGRFVCYDALLAGAEPLPAPLADDDETATRTVRALVTAAVNDRVAASERPVAFLLSGGLDSGVAAAVGAAAAAARGARIHTFCVAFDDPRGFAPDAFYAERLAARLGAEHTTVTFTADEAAAALDAVVRCCETADPNTVRAAVPMYLLARHIATKTPFRVILSGEGADEALGGYAYFPRAPRAVDVAEEARRLVRNLHAFDVLRADRVMAAWGLDLRVPFLDAGFLRYVLRTDGARRAWGAGIEKALLRNAFDDRGPLRESGVLWRGKERLTDGCGGGYVPAAVRAAAARVGPEAAAAAAKSAHLAFSAAAAHYKAVADAAFGAGVHDAWAPPRVLPAWVAAATGGGDAMLAA